MAVLVTTFGNDSRCTMQKPAMASARVSAVHTGPISMSATTKASSEAETDIV